MRFGCTSLRGTADILAKHSHADIRTGLHDHTAKLSAVAFRNFDIITVDMHKSMRCVLIYSPDNSLDEASTGWLGLQNLRTVNVLW